MEETPHDLEVLERLLDVSYDASGPHLREVITPERRFGADQLASILTGMRLLVLALLGVYVPRYGPSWEEFLDRGPVSARIDADRMYTFSMSP